MCRLICNLPKLSIRILIRSLPIFINRYEFWITDPNILCCRIAYPTEQQPCCFLTFQAINSMCRLICNLPELSIRILIRLLPIFINRYELRIKDPYILCCRIAYPTEQQPCCFFSFQAANSLDCLIVTRLMRHLYNRFEPTKLMCRLICNLPEQSIRILIRLLPISD